MDVEIVKVGGRGQGDDGEETQRGGSKKGAQEREGVLLRIGKRGRRSLSVHAERKKRWRRIPIP